MDKGYINRLYGWVALAGFVVSAVYLLLFSSSMMREYQDSWVLDDIVLPMVVFLGFYIVAIVANPDSKLVAVLASIQVFVMSAAPAIKYRFPYYSSVDSSVHFQSIKVIADNGRVDAVTSYVNTPGFHALTAVLSQVSGLDFDVWYKVISPLLGCLIPLCFYMLTERLEMEQNISVMVVAVSGFAAPIYYLMEGTSFTLPLFLPIVVFMIIRYVGDGSIKLGMTLSVLLLVVAVTFWHPSTSLVMCFVFIVAGIVSGYVVDRGKKVFSYDIFMSIGVTAVVLTLSYWMYSAGYVWDKFAKNIRIAIQPYNSIDLIPDRLFQIDFSDRLMIGLIYHARDMVFLLLSILGVYIWFRARDGIRGSGSVVKIYVALWLSCLAIVAGVFVAGFGAQGYRRFLSYGVLLSPIMVGYALHKISDMLRTNASALGGIGRVAMLTVVISVSAFQLFPYQPMIPSHISDGKTEQDTPLLWLHQVNTTSQYHALDYVRGSISPDRQVITDYIGYQQFGMFFGLEQKSRLRLPRTQRQEAAYIVLHIPGTAGAYVEQAEYRSRDNIDAWKNRKGIDVIYDNGGSFVLYHPNNGLDPFDLEK